MLLWLHLDHGGDHEICEADEQPDFDWLGPWTKK